MSGRRPYNLGKRQASVDRTRRRILDAAILEYTESGIGDTSMLAVARRADVAPGTVLYHYPTPDALAEAVVERWISEMEAPSPEVIDVTADLEDRVLGLVEELYGLYERSEQAYRVYQKDPRHPVLARYEAWWFDNVRQMMSRALGSSDVESLQVVSVLVNPGFRGTLVEAGIAPRRAVEIAAGLALDHLRRAASDRS